MPGKRGGIGGSGATLSRCSLLPPWSWQHLASAQLPQCKGPSSGGLG